MRKIQRITAVASATALFLSPLSAATAEEEALGSISLATVLDVPNAAFDSTPGDFDIFTAVFLETWGERPNSPVQAIVNGDTALTAFVPTDRAFRKLVTYLTGKTIKSEAAVADAVMSLGAKTVEKVILYHVVVGNPILSPAALQSNGAKLNAASGETFGVRVSGTTITLVDKAKKHTNAVVLLSKVDINKGNRQVAHGINQVLLPTLS